MSKMSTVNPASAMEKSPVLTPQERRQQLIRQFSGLSTNTKSSMANATKNGPGSPRVGVNTMLPIALQRSVTTPNRSMTLQPSGASAVNAVLENLRANQTYDFLRVSDDIDLKRYFQSLAVQNKALETVQFSDNVTKINRKEKHQLRQLVITDHAIYNFKNQKYNERACKRRIELTTIKCVVLSMCSTEIVFQVADSYDYRFCIQKRTELLEMLNKSFMKRTGVPLPITHSEEKNLVSHVTTKNMQRNNDSSIPKRRSLLQRLSTMSSIFSSDSCNTDRAVQSFLRWCGDVGHYEGWLSKKKGIADRWERKYIVIEPNQLSYYAPKFDKSISLTKDIIVRNMPSNEPGCDFIPNSPRLSGGIFSSSGDGTNAFPLDDMNADLDEFGRSIDSFEDMQKHILPDLDAQPYFWAWRIFIKSNARRQPLYLAAESEAEFKRWMVALHSRNNAEKSHYIDGWLLQQYSTTDWSRRFFVLHDARLWSFEMEYKGGIEFTPGFNVFSANIVEPTEKSPQKWSLNSKSSFAWRFNIKTDSQIFYFAADSFEDQQTWMTALMAAAKSHANRPRTVGDVQAMPSPAVAKNANNERLLAQEAPEGEITFVFTDVESSTSLWESVPDAMDVALESHDNLLRSLLAKHHGYEVKTEGDAFIVTFAKVLDAVLWCMEVQVMLLRLDWPKRLLEQPSACVVSVNDNIVFNGIRVRMGIHTGQPNCRRNPVTGRMDYFGPVVNRSARVSGTAHGGQVVCTQEVIEELRKLPDFACDDELIPQIHDLGKQSLNGVDGLIHIFQLMPKALKSRVLPPLRSIANHIDSPTPSSSPEISSSTSGFQPISPRGVSSLKTSSFRLSSGKGLFLNSQLRDLIPRSSSIDSTM